MAKKTTPKRAAPKNGKGEVRADGWLNVLTGLGAAMRDKTMASTVEVCEMGRQEVETLWRADDMAARIVEKLPEEMLREGYDICVPDWSEDQTAALCRRLEELDADAKFTEALQYERAYGGSAILIGANDGVDDLRLPLNIDRVRSVDWLTTLHRYELSTTDWYSDPRAPKFGQPRLFRLQADSVSVSSEDAAKVTLSSWVEIHESRFLIFPGQRTSRRQVQINQGWGDSVFIRTKKVLADFGMTWNAAAVLISDFSQAVLKVKDLADLIATNQDDVVIKRAQVLDMARSVARMMMIDAEEDFERKPTPMTGLPEMLQQFALRLAAAVDMPVTLLMGQAPAGLNATGDSDIRSFYDRAAAKQRKHLQPPLRRLVQMLMREGGKQEPASWHIEFKPLWQLTDLEKADVRLKTSQADASDIMAGVLTPEEVAASRYREDGYSTETVIDVEGRKKMTALPKELPEDKPKPAPEKEPA